jgi:chorismate dehydratase
MKITAVSYLNTKPFIYGLYRSELSDSIELSLDIPSVCAQKLRTGEADLALTPVAIIPELPEAYLVSDYCIGSTGAVRTVCIFSEVPLADIRHLYLDFHSRTSVALARILCARYWRIAPEFLAASAGFEQKIGGTTAGLIIGDRAFGLEKRYPYVYDLAQAWADWTGMPFVFAAWVSARPLSDDFVLRFNHALQAGLDHLPELMKILPSMPPDIDLETYYRHNISYHLDHAKWQALQRFLTYVAGENGFVLRRALPPALR